MRIQINLNEEILNKVEEEAHRLGVSRGSMITTWIGEKINSLEQVRGMYKDILNDPNMQEVFKNTYRKENENK